MLNKIKKLLKLKHEIDNKVFRQALSQYPYNTETIGSYLYHITDVSATEKDGKVKVTICTHRPGILIGVRGEQIAGIKSLMERMSNKKVEIFIVEEKMFSALYY